MVVGLKAALVERSSTCPVLPDASSAHVRSIWDDEAGVATRLLGAVTAAAGVPASKWALTLAALSACL